MSTLTEEDLTILEALDFLPPCEHSGHERNGASGPAAWVVLMAPILECGCHAPSAVLWCEDCKNRILARDAVNCNSCRSLLNPAQNVVHIEALR